VKWLELSIEVHPEAVDAVTNVFQEHDTGGVSIEQPIQSHIEGEEPLRFIGLPVIKAYLPMIGDVAERERAIEEDLWHLQAFNLSPVGPLERREIEEEDWANGWKEHFHPLRIGKVVIKPSWREFDAEPGDLVVELDPGMAFGTGLHPTTALMVRAVQKRVRPGMKVLDLGTGSGILAIAAGMLGATVTATDISDVAVEVAQQNVAANGMSGCITVELGSIDVVQGRHFDLILANIIARVIAELADPLTAALEPGAELLASGIIEERADVVRGALRAAGLELVEEEAEGDWWLMVGRRPS
jgi:ribosomal protein L11 methyltransferase